MYQREQHLRKEIQKKKMSDIHEKYQSPRQKMKSTTPTVNDDDVKYYIKKYPLKA